MDSSATVAVNAIDQYGNLATTESRPIILVTNGSATGAGLVNIVGGTGSKFIGNRVIGPVKLSLSIAITLLGVDITSVQTFSFFSGVSTTVSFSAPMTWASVDRSVSVVIQALDQYGNIAVSESRSITLSTNGSVTGAGIVTFQQGIALKSIRDSVAELVILSLQDTNSLGLNISSTSIVSFSPGNTTQLIFFANSPTIGTCDSPVAIVVHALDQFGNINEMESGTIALLVSSPGIVSNTVTFFGGVASGSVQSQLPQSVVISLGGLGSTGALHSATWNVTFSPGTQLLLDIAVV